MSRIIPKSFLYSAKKNQQQHVLDMSRDITIVTGEQLSEECPNCYFDTVAGTSAAAYTGLTGLLTVFSGTSYERTFQARNFRQICPVCKGTGFFSVPVEIVIRAHVNWFDSSYQRSESYVGSPAGAEGQNKVKLKSNSFHYNNYLRAEYFIVDGIKVLPDTTPIIRGVGQDQGIVEIWCKTTESSDKRIRG